MREEGEFLSFSVSEDAPLNTLIVFVDVELISLSVFFLQVILEQVILLRMSAIGIGHYSLVLQVLVVGREGTLDHGLHIKVELSMLACAYGALHILVLVLL